MYLTPLLLANTLLYYAFEEHLAITVSKLNKLIWFWEMQYVKMTHERLFTEAYIGNKFSPVLASLQWGWGGYGNRPIRKFVKQANGAVSVIDIEGEDAVAVSFRIMWDEYKDYTNVELSRIIRAIVIESEESSNTEEMMNIENIENIDDEKRD